MRSDRLCAVTAMWAMVALSLSVILVLVCSLLIVTPPAAAIESVVLEMDISVSLTGNFNIITIDHVKAISLGCATG